MIAEARLIELVEHIYVAAADPACWQAALNSLAECYPDGLGTIVHHDVKLGSGSFPIASSSWDTTWVDTYNHYYASVNPWLKNLKKRPVGLAVPAEFMLDRGSLLKTEFYCDFMKPRNIASGVGVTINQDRDRFIAVSVLYPERTAESGRDNVALLQRLAPHFRRAMQVNRQLARARIDSAAAEAGLDRIAAGFILLDGVGRSIFRNKAAERILAANDGLALNRDGCLVACSTSDTARLRKAIEHAVRPPGGDISGSGSAFRIGRPSGMPAYSAMVSPLRSRHQVADAMACVLVTDNGRSCSVPARLLSDIFGVTIAEGRLLTLLIDGRSVAEAADALGISVATARTHLKHIYAKMDCTRQSDLVHQVMGHPVWMLDSL